MSFAKSKYLQLADKNGPCFTGGIIDNNEPNLIPYQNTPFGRNFRVNGQGISIAPGFVQVGDNFDSQSNYARGIAAYLRSNPANDSIIVNYPLDSTHKLLGVNPITYAQTPISTAGLITSTNRMNFLSANDSLYCMNGVDLFGKLNGVTYSNPNTGVNTTTFSGLGLNDMNVHTSGTTGGRHVYIITIDANGSPDTFKWNVDGGAFTTGVPIVVGTNALGANGLLIVWGAATGHTIGNSWTITTGLVPSFGVWFDNSLFVAGDTTFPNRMYKSAENNPESFSGSGSDIFDSSYPVTGLAVGGQTLYVFSETTIDMLNNNSIKQVGSSLVYTSVPLEATEGSVNHNSIVSVGEDVYYLSKSNKIKKVAPNSMLHYGVLEMSHRRYQGITKTMSTLDDDQTQSFAVHLPDFQLIKWYVKTKGANFNNLCIVYHYEFDEFMADDHRVFNGECWYKSKAFAISEIEPKIYLDEYGTTYDGTPTQFYYRCKNLDFGEPTINKELRQSRTFLGINTLATVTQNIYADGGLIDTVLIDKNDIPVVVEGIGTHAIGTYAIGEESQPNTQLYNISIVREKGDLQVRAKHFEFEYKCSTLGAQILLQRLEPRIEMLDQLTTSTN